jgi:hypothetical protein
MDTSKDLYSLIYDIERLLAVFVLEDLDSNTPVPAESVHYNRTPATAADIEFIENEFQVKLPEDYKAFLLIRNGWKNFSGDYDLLSTDEMVSRQVREKIAEFRDIWQEEAGIKDAFFIYLGYGRVFGFFDYRNKANNQEPELHFYDIGLSFRYKSFSEYLVAEKVSLERSLTELGWKPA